MFLQQRILSLKLQITMLQFFLWQFQHQNGKKKSCKLLHIHERPRRRKKVGYYTDKKKTFFQNFLFLSTKTVKNQMYYYLLIAKSFSHTLPIQREYAKILKMSFGLLTCKFRAKSTAFFTLIDDCQKTDFSEWHWSSLIFQQIKDFIGSWMLSLAKRPLGLDQSLFFVCELSLSLIVWLFECPLKKDFCAPWLWFSHP